MKFYPARHLVHQLAVIAGITIAFPAVAGDSSVIGSIDTVPLGPGGEWASQNTTRLALNPSTGRLFTVVRGGEGDPEMDYTLLSFDISTLSLAAEVPLQVTSGFELRGLVTSGLTNELFMAWDDSTVPGSSERRAPHHIDVIDLEMGSSSSDSPLPLRLFDIVADISGEMLYGISPPEMGEENYRIARLNVADRTVQYSPLDVSDTDALPQDIVVDASRERLLVLFSILQPGTSDLLEPTGYVTAFDLETGATLAHSNPFPGEFTAHSLDISPDNQVVIVAAGEFGTDPMPLLEADSLSLVRTLNGGPGFTSQEAAIFVSNNEIWVSNASEGQPDLSIAVFDIHASTPTGFIADASESQAFLLDPVLDRVFVASQGLGSLYVLDATATRMETQLDVTVEPFDFVADPLNNLFLLLSRQGRLYLVSDETTGATPTAPRLVSRRNGLGANARAGLLQDFDRDRLIVGRQPKGKPRLLETTTYAETGELPLPAEALALDALSNRIYSIHAKDPDNLFFGQTIRSIDADSLVPDATPVGNLPDALIPPANGKEANIESAVDEESQSLFVLSPAGLFSNPRLTEFNLVDGTSQEFVFTNPIAQVNHLSLDIDRDRVLLVENDTIRFFPTAGAVFEPTESLTLSEGEDTFIVFDSAPDRAKDRMYYLVYYARSIPLSDGFSLIAVSLVGDATQPATILGRVNLDFISGNNSSLAYNPLTDRFAVCSSPNSNIHLFDNPFASKSGKVSGLEIISGDIIQATNGISFQWLVPPSAESDVEAYMIERKRATLDTLPDDWIRLTPAGIPSSVTGWLDSTVESGTTYSYRVSVLSRTRLFAPLEIGPASWTPTDSSWIPHIPQVEFRAHAGEAIETTLFLRPDRPRHGFVDIAAIADSALVVSVTPEQIPLPGTAAVTIQTTTSTPTGAHGITFRLTEGPTTAAVQLILRVFPPTDQIRTASVLRQPAEIFMTSDSRLDSQRFSVRGQLGVSRKVAEPTGLKVFARTPSGEVRSSTGVIAATGEFTAEFVLDASESNLEDWRFRAVWNGSTDSVGGSSLISSLPRVTPGTKGPASPAELGSIVLVQGTPQEDSQAAREELELMAERVYSTFLSNRFEEKMDDSAVSDFSLGSIVSITPEISAIQNAVTGADAAERFVLLYLLGDAEAQAGSVEFRLKAGESLIPEQVRNLIVGITPPTVPLVVLDCPHAERFRSELEGQTGAFVFSCQKSFGTISISNGFSRSFINHIGRGSKFIGAASRVTQEYIIGGAADSGAVQEPSWIESPEFEDVDVLYAFTPPRSLMRDGIAPTLIDVAPSATVALGDVVEARMKVDDPPFGNPISEAYLAITHPDGWTDISPLEPLGDEYRASVTISLPGQTLLAYTAIDAAGNISRAETSLTSESGAISAEELLLLFSGVDGAGQPIETGRRSSLMWWVSQEWQQTP